MRNTRIRLILSTLATIILASNINAQEPKRMAVVQTSTCYMRLQPDYESALETQELMGTVVEIVGEQGYWREIVSPQPYKAWTTEKTLVEMTPEELKAYEEAPKYIYTAHYGHVYTTPTNHNPSAICDVVGGDVLRVVEKLKGSASPSGKHGKWVEVMLPSGRTGWVLKKDVRPLNERIDIRMGDSAEGLVSVEKMEDVIRQAYSLLGVPYLWGGMSSKGVDCSGLVRISHIMNGILLPRNASQQIKCGERIEMEVEYRCWEILTSPAAPQNDNVKAGLQNKNTYDLKEEMLRRVKNLQRGDLVFFGTPATDEKPMRITHVGIYLGENKIIHSSHRVRINSLIPGDDDYYELSLIHISEPTRPY